MEKYNWSWVEIHLEVYGCIEMYFLEQGFINEAIAKYCTVPNPYFKERRNVHE